MTVQQLIALGIVASIMALVFSLGLKAADGDLLYLIKRPGKLVRSILAMNIVMLAFAIAAAWFLPLARVIEVALIALTVSPVPPILPGKQVRAGGSEPYALSLLVVASIVAIVLVPVSIEAVGSIFPGEYHMPAARVVPPVLTTVVVPLVLGIAVRKLLPALAERLAHPVSLLALVLMLAAAIPVVVVTGITFWSLVGNGVVAFLVLFTVLGLVVGHLLGGPEPEDRTVLALATGTRHPGIAIAIAGLNFPDAKATALSVMLWHLIIGAIVSIPYVRWRKALHADAAGAPDEQTHQGDQ